MMLARRAFSVLPLSLAAMRSRQRAMTFRKDWSGRIRPRSGAISCWVTPATSCHVFFCGSRRCLTSREDLISTSRLAKRAHHSPDPRGCTSGAPVVAGPLRADNRRMPDPGNDHRGPALGFAVGAQGLARSRARRNYYERVELISCWSGTSSVWPHLLQDMLKSDWLLIAVAISILTASIPWLLLIAR